MESRNSTSPDIRQELSQALASEAEHFARLVTDDRAEIQKFPAPFLNRYSIYQVEYFAPSKPILFYVGFASGRPAYLLTGRPEDFVRLSKEDGVVINSEAVAVDYAIASLTITRSMSDLFYLVRSADEVRFRPNLTADEKRIEPAFLEKYRDLIEPPTAQKQGDSYVVTCFAVRQQQVERHRLTMSATGDIESEVTMIEQNLPLVYGL